VSRCETDDYVYDVKVDGDYAYLADQGGGLQIVDISTLSAPVIVGTHVTSYDAYGVFVSGDYAYVAVDSDGLEIVDISVKTAPVQAGIIDTDSSALDVFVSGGMAYVADYNSVAVIDVSTPTAPVLEEGYNPTAEIEDLFTVGDLLYLACDESGLQILDGSNPAELARLGGCLATGTMERVFVHGTLAYLAAGEDGMHIFDVSVTSQPVQIGHLPARYRVKDMYVRPPYAYVADAGLRVVDISNPASPLDVGFRVTSRASGVWVSGDTAYVADSDYGIRIIDVQNPFAPTLLATYTKSGFITETCVYGNTLYASFSGYGLEIVDVGNPALPVNLGGYPISGGAYDVHVSGNHAVVVDNSLGLQVIDVQDPETPVFAAGYDTDYFGQDLAVANGHAYLSEPNDNLIKIFRVGSSNAAVVACTPDRFELATSVGQSPMAASFEVMNAGTGTLNYSVSSDVPWIVPLPTSGSSSGESDTITLTFSTAGLTAGWHTGTVTVAEIGALNSPFPIPIELWIEPLPLAITTSALPNGMEMVPYSETLAASDGMPPYVWTQVSGWPGGLTNATDGTVAGKPTLAGTYSASAEVTDARGKTASRSVTVQIQPNPNRPPVISSTVPTPGTFPMAEQTNQLFSVTATDPEAVPLSYTWSLGGVPVGSGSSAYTFNTIWGDAGTYELEVLVSDGLWDTVIAAWTIEVTDDNDGDGIPNDFENAHPLLSAWNAADGAADNDGDHLDNYGEYLAGTLLDNPDCDSDSLPDGWEVRYGFDPLDAPGGLPGILCMQEGRWTSSGPWDGAVYSLTVEGSYVYAGVREASDNRGFRVFDVSTPSNPTLVGTWNDTSNGSYYREIVIQGNYAYMGQDSIGMRTFDISNPAAPIHKNIVYGQHRGIVVDGNDLYASDYYTGLKTYTLGNPAAPAANSSLPAASLGWDVAKQGSHLFIARDYYGLQVVDVGNPSVPFAVKTLDLPSNGTAFAIAIKDDHAYIADDSPGMQVVDISTPTNPVWTASCNTPGSAFDIHISGNYAYVADYESYQMLVIDISDPTAPRQVGSYNTGTYTYTAQCSGNMVYVGAGNGLHVVKCTSEDTDADGMLDAWEMDQWATLDRTGLDDFDGDGISDLGEFRAGLNPKNDDEDGDGIIDGIEVNTHNSDPRNGDSDGDGISDSGELIAGTSPSDPNDYFHVASMDGQLPATIYFQSLNDRQYQMFGCSNLVDGLWFPVPGAEWRMGIGGADSMADTNQVPATRFYRLEVSQP